MLALGLAGRLEGLGPSALLTAHEIDGAPVDEREQPCRCLPAFGHERLGSPPDREEGVLNGVLGERVVPQDPQCQAVSHAAEPVVQLGEGLLVRAGHERDDRFIGEMGERAGHRNSLAHRR